MTDHEIAVVGLGVTVVAGVGTWLSLPQLQGWWKRRDDGAESLSLNLNNASPYRQAMAPGIARATEKTLVEIDHGLPASVMLWIHEKDFGNAFRWSMIQPIEDFAWLPAVPAREFLDRDLEMLRLELVASAKDFIHLAASTTDDVHPSGDSDIRKIPDQYDERGDYSDRLFFQKSRELNDSAEKVWSLYQGLFRRARLKLAYSDIGEEEA